MLKFEGVAEVGDRIRGYDFEPMPGRTERFIEGTVIAKGTTDNHRLMGAAVYTINIDTDSAASETHTRVGDVGYVPFETTFDFDNRVAKV